jgi:hypothetical protein
MRIKGSVGEESRRWWGGEDRKGMGMGVWVGVGMRIEL